MNSPPVLPRCRNPGEGTIALAGDASGDRLRKLTREARALVSPRSLLDFWR